MLSSLSRNPGLVLRLARCALVATCGLLGPVQEAFSQPPRVAGDPSVPPETGDAGPMWERDPRLVREEHWRSLGFEDRLRAAGASAISSQPALPLGCAPPPDGRWRYYPLGITGQGIFDTERKRFIIPTAGVPEVQVLEYSSPPGTWHFACAEGTPPSAIGAHAVDPANDRAFVVGWTGEVVDDANVYGVWELRLSPAFAWRRLDIGGVTGPAYALNWLLFGFQAFWDAPRERLIIFQQVWTFRVAYALELSSPWRLTLISGQNWSPDLVLSGEQAVLDATGNRLLTFGGGYQSYLGGHGSYEWHDNTVGQLRLDVPNPAWAELTSGPLAGRSGAVVAFDSRRNRLLVAGGASTVVQRDIWEARMEPTPEWSRLAETMPAQGFAFRPGGCDEETGELLLYSNYPADEIWAFSPQDRSWRALADRVIVGETPLNGPSIFDIARDRLVQHGGASFVTDRAFWLDSSPSDGLAWGPFPNGPPRSGHAGVHDSRRDRFVVLAGRGAELRSDVWVMSLDPPAWSELVIPGEVPAPRTQATAAYDPVGDRIVLHGGLVRGDNGWVRTNETWLLDLGGPRWSRLAPSDPAPPASDARACVYDPDRRRILLVGPDTWELPLDRAPSWRRLLTSGPAPSVALGGATFDDSRGAVIVKVPAGTWELSLDGSPTWRVLAPQGTNPGPYDHSLCYDPNADRVLLSWGSTLWTLDRGNPVIRMRMRMAPEIVGAAAAARVRAELFGSPEVDVRTIDAATIRLSGAWPLPDDARQRTADLDHDGHLDLVLGFSLDDVRTVASRGPLVLRGATTSGRLLRGEAGLSLRGQPPREGLAMLPTDEPVVPLAALRAAHREGRLVVSLGEAVSGALHLECFDVHGRRLASRSLHKATDSRLEITLDESIRWPPGLTFVRLRAPQLSTAVRVVRF